MSSWVVEILSGVAIRLRRVGSQVNAVNLDKVGRVVSGAKLKRGIARNLQVVADGDIGSLAIENAESRRRCQAGSQAGGNGRESHRAKL
jgi:hypothetical protein